MQDALRAAHFPQHIDIDRALATRYFMRQLDLCDAATDAIFDKLLMAFGAGFAVEHLRNHVAIFVIAVGIDCRYRADASSGGPSARACMIGCGNALAAFDQRPDFLAAIDNGFQPLEHKYDPYVMQKCARKRAPLRFALSQIDQLCRAKSARFIAEP